MLESPLAAGGGPEERRRRPTALTVILTSVVATVLSIARLWVSNSEMFSNLVWAEDGLFPLCVRDHGYFACLVDPYEGYLLFLSRTLALPVAAFDLTLWPLVTNLVAAISAGLAAGLMAWLLVRSGVSYFAAGLSGTMTVLVPIVGLEAINVYGSAYMALLIIATILVGFRFNPELPLWLTPTILCITALTIPSSVVLLIPLLIQLIRIRKLWSAPMFAALGLLSGLFLQALVISTASVSRPVVLTADSISEWISYLPVSLSTFVPNHISLEVMGRLNSDWVPANVWQGIVLLVILTLAALRLLKSPNSVRQGAGWLIVMSLLLSAMPAIIGYSNNRYFVVLIVAISISLIVLFDSLRLRFSSIVLPILASVVIVLWLPAFGASNLRSGASPSWQSMLEAALSDCEKSAQRNVDLTFTPNWPFEDANFQGPTTNNVSCEYLLSRGP